ncbi:MAG: efflux RND transporter permease subunit [Desulforhopalus sp.]
MELTDKKSERFFRRLAGEVVRFRVVALVAMLLLAGGLGAQIRHLTINTSNEGFLRENDPILEIYNDFRDQFGRDDMLAIALHSENIFSETFLARLKELHAAVEEEVPHVKDVTSMVNARNTRGEGDVLLVDDLLAEFPEDSAALIALRERVMDNPLYRNQLISEDGTFTAMVIESMVYQGDNGEEDLLSGFDDGDAGDAEEDAPAYLTDEENGQMVNRAKELAARFAADDFQLYMAGTPVVTHTVKQFMMKDMKRFLRLAVVTIGICLFVMFRRLSGVVLPLLVVVCALVSTLGTMALFSVQFKTPTIILPSFLLAVGVGASVHVLSLVFQGLRRGKTRHEAIISSFAHSGLAIVMTSLTTAAGLASFGAAKVAPIGDLGIFSAVGVMLALVYTLILLPALLAILPLKQKAKDKESRVVIMDRVIDWIIEFSVGRCRLIVAIAAIIIVFGISGIFQLRFSHNVLNWLPADLDVRQATETIDHNLRGSVVLEVLVDTGRENGIYDRQFLLQLDKLTDELELYEKGSVFVGKVVSVTTILKEINQALHGNDPAHYKIPDNEKLIPQEFLLFENSGSDDLQDVVDSRFQVARITIKVPWLDALLYVPFMQEIKTGFSEHFDDMQLEGAQPMAIEVTGIMSLFGRIIHTAIYAAAQSYVIAMVVITMMMILLIGNLRLGLLSMIPNLGPILVVLGVMGWLNIPLDMFTMLIASIAIGLAVDDTIHFMYHFKRNFEATSNVKISVSRALHTAGRAIITTSIVLSVGFFIFMFASMNNVYFFGTMTGLAILLALAGNIFLAPALMALVLGGRESEKPAV